MIGERRTTPHTTTDTLGIKELRACHGSLVNWSCNKYLSHEDGVRERRRPGPRSRAPTSEQDQAAEGGARAEGRHKKSSFHGGVMTCEAATRVSLSAACTSLRSVPPAADCCGAGVSHGKKLVQIQKGYEPGFVLTVEDFGRADGITLNP
jgi:hypothetical protein